MILDLLFNGIYIILDGLLNLVPKLDTVQIPDGIFSALSYLTDFAGYFLPLSDLALIFGLYVVVTNFRFIYNLFFRLWDALPFT